MSRSHFGVSALTAAALVALIASPAQAEQLELANDSFVSGTAAAFQGGFVDGERFAARFYVDPAEFPLTLVNVDFLFGGNSGNANLELHVWLDDGMGYASLASQQSGFPGTLVWDSPGEYEVQGSNVAMQRVSPESASFSSANGYFWVGFTILSGCTSGTCFPGPARDDDGGVAGPKMNAIYAAQLSAWVDNTVLGVQGDWVLRLTVETAGGTVEVEPDVADEPADVADVADASDTTTDVIMADPLTVSEISPNRIQVGTSQLVQVRGTGFGSALILRLGPTELESIEVLSDTVATATVPATLAVGVYDLFAQNPGDIVFTFPSAFEVVAEEVVPPPVILSVTPTQGVPGDMVTVRCSGLQDGAELTLGSLALVNSQVGDGLVFAVPSSLVAGSYDITVRNPDDQFDVELAAFTILGAPTGGDDDEGCACSLRRERSTGLGAFGVGACFLGLLAALRRRR